MMSFLSNLDDSIRGLVRPQVGPLLPNLDNDILEKLFSNNSYFREGPGRISLTESPPVVTSLPGWGSRFFPKHLAPHVAPPRL